MIEREEVGNGVGIARPDPAYPVWWAVVRTVELLVLSSLERSFWQRLETKSLMKHIPASLRNISF